MYELKQLIVFVTGAPAKDWDKTNPDYVPSINLAPSAASRRGNPVQKLQRFIRFRRRFGRVVNAPVARRGGKSPHPGDDIKTEAFPRCQDEAEDGKECLEHDLSYLRTEHSYVPLPASQSEIFSILIVKQVDCLFSKKSRHFPLY